MKKNLKVSFLGGVEEIGKNLTILEYANSMIIIDAGIAFPDNEIYPGVDYIRPSFDYIIENKSKIQAILLTHGHEDHIGAMPDLIKEVKVPIYGSNVALGFLQSKLERYGTKSKIKTITVSDESPIVEIGPFKVEFVRVTHSIAGAYALWIKTPKGGVFFTGDFKIDHTPIDNKRTNLARIAEIGREGVLLLLSDSTNADKPGYALSEKEVGKSFDNLFNEHEDKRIIVATFASHLHRIQQVYNCAVKYGRKVCLIGKSLENNMEIARSLGELKMNDAQLIHPSKIKDCRDKNICIIATGSQGEPNSALSKMSRDYSKDIKISENDTVILSARTIPGNEKTIYKMVNSLSELGATVIYKSLYDIHCSGHAYQEELKLMLALVNPSFFIPVHGEYRHMKKHAELARQMGVHPKNILIPSLGLGVAIEKKGFKDRVVMNLDNVYMAGNIESTEGEIVERRILAEEGVMVIWLPMDRIGLPVGEIKIITKGVSLDENILGEISLLLRRELEDGNVISFTNEEIEASVIRLAKRFMRNAVRKLPYIIPIIDKEEY